MFMVIVVFEIILGSFDGVVKELDKVFDVIELMV